MPGPSSASEWSGYVSATLVALDHACDIIETGDQRLLASDGPAGGQPPELSLAEWRKLYQTLNKERTRLRALMK